MTEKRPTESGPGRLKPNRLRPVDLLRDAFLTFSCAPTFPFCFVFPFFFSVLWMFFFLFSFFCSLNLCSFFLFPSAQTALLPDRPSPGPPFPRTAQNFRHLFLLSPPIPLFFLFLVVFFVELWRRFKAMARPNCTFGTVRNPSQHKMTPEKPKRAIWVGHGLDPEPQFNEKAPDTEKKSELGTRRGQKKREILGLQPFGHPPSGSPPFGQSPHLGPPTCEGPTNRLRRNPFLPDSGAPFFLFFKKKRKSLSSFHQNNELIV